MKSSILQNVFCLLGFHRYPFFQLKELIWNPDIDLGGDIACLTLSKKCTQCGHIAIVRTQIFRADQMANMPDKKREKLITDIFENTPGYKSLC